MEDTVASALARDAVTAAPIAVGGPALANPPPPSRGRAEPVVDGNHRLRVVD